MSEGFTDASEPHYWGRAKGNRLHLWQDMEFTDCREMPICGQGFQEQMLIDNRPKAMALPKCERCLKLASQVTVVDRPSKFYASLGV